MTEVEWLECDAPHVMWKWLQSQHTWLRWLGESLGTIYWQPSRKELLFALGFCHCTDWEWCSTRLQAIHVAEAVLEGPVGKKDREAVHETYYMPWELLGWLSEAAQRTALCESPEAAKYQASLEAHNSLYCNLVREIFGNPFCSPHFDSAWLTWRDSTIPRLAQEAYDKRILPSGTLDPARLAIRADALEEAGCTTPEILHHLRGPGPHVRGCWCVDLLLGKA